MHLVLPSDLLEEIANSGIKIDSCSPTNPAELADLSRKDFDEFTRFSEIPMVTRYLHYQYEKRKRRLRERIVKDLKSTGVNVLHNPFQSIKFESIVKRFPYVINPHDFQHEHFPEFFSNQELEMRRTIWYRNYENAAALVVHSVQTKQDILDYLNIPEERIFYAPYGALDTFPAIDESKLALTKSKFGLRDGFVFYPARMWPHKNHITLIRAIAYLKKRGVTTDCVFTDANTEYGKFIVAAVKEMGLENHVKIVGRVAPEEMSALYILSTMVVVPSLFEQNSGPMLEAIHFGKAIAASNLPELASTLKDGGLLFDGRSMEEIVSAIEYTFASDANRRALETASEKRKKELSWAPFVVKYKEAYLYALDKGPSV
jgi:glycosyltransferase involved in cell wall biosynthesis